MYINQVAINSCSLVEVDTYKLLCRTLKLCVPRFARRNMRRYEAYWARCATAHFVSLNARMCYFVLPLLVNCARIVDYFKGYRLQCATSYPLNT